MNRSGALRVFVAMLCSVVVAVSGINSASGHFAVASTSTAAGSLSLLTFSASHGCLGHGWYKVAIQIPDSIEIARPAMKPGWTIETTGIQSASPEGEILEKLTSVTFTASSPEYVVPDHFYDEFRVQVQLPALVGEVIYFPVVQTCEEGEYAWIQVPAEGQDEEDLEFPAPYLTVTEPEETP